MEKSAIKQVSTLQERKLIQVTRKIHKYERKYKLKERRTVDIVLNRDLGYFKCIRENVENCTMKMK